jgi:Ankyrin repeats (many copies)
MFPEKRAGLYYYSTVLDHIFNPKEEDYYDPSGWIQDVETVEDYISSKINASTSQQLFNELLNSIESNSNNLEIFVKSNLFHVVNKDRKISEVIEKIKFFINKYHEQSGVLVDKELIVKINNVLTNITDDKVEALPILTKQNNELICSPIFLYDSSGAFLDAIKNHLSDVSWDRIKISDFILSREEAQVLTEANIQLAPKHLRNLIYYLGFEGIDIIKELTPLQLAIVKQDLEQIRNLVDHLEKTSSTQKVCKLTTLDIAILTGNLEVVKILIENFHIDLDQENSIGLTPVTIATKIGHLPILEFLLDSGAKPIIQDTNQLMNSKLLLKRGAKIPVEYLISHRSLKTTTSKRLSELFIGHVSQLSSEVNEHLNIKILSHAWSLKGKAEIKELNEPETSTTQVNLEGSLPQINCEIMSKTWKEFCQKHPRDMSIEYQTFIGNALECASESNILNAENLFAYYKNGLPIIIPSGFTGPSTGHCVGVLIWKDYMCVYNGGAGKKEGALFHGRFQANLLNPAIIETVKSMPNNNIEEYKDFFYERLPKLTGFTSSDNDLFIKYLSNVFSGGFQIVGNCTWHNPMYLINILLFCKIYGVEKRKEDDKVELQATYTTVYNMMNEWEAFQQADLLRIYLSSAERKKYALDHDFIMRILRSSWGSWLDNISQETKNILYKCEELYLNLLTPQKKSLYKADKVISIVKRWEGHTLYPDRLRTKNKRIR